MTDGEHGLDDFDVGEYDRSDDLTAVMVTDGEKEIVYPEGSDCEFCHRESDGVVIVEYLTKTDHSAICDTCFGEVEKEWGKDNVKFRTYK